MATRATRESGRNREYVLSNCRIRSRMRRRHGRPSGSGVSISHWVPMASNLNANVPTLSPAASTASTSCQRTRSITGSGVSRSLACCGARDGEPASDSR